MIFRKKRTNKNKKEMKKEMIASYKNLGILKNYFIEFNIERKKILFLKICLRYSFNYLDQFFGTFFSNFYAKDH